jgi:hypothetical protein
MAGFLWVNFLKIKEQAPSPALCDLGGTGFNLCWRGLNLQAPIWATSEDENLL